MTKRERERESDEGRNESIERERMGRRKEKGEKMQSNDLRKDTREIERESESEKDRKTDREGLY